MKHLIKHSILALTILFSTGLFISCNNNTKSCQETVCTAEFVVIAISVVDQSQNPVILDSYEVINLENNTAITLSLSGVELDSFIQNGSYPIMDDLSIEDNQQLNLQLTGTLNGQEVVNESYIVSSDCCHVGLVSGDMEITIN